jgi:hypothetical protein
LESFAVEGNAMSEPSANPLFVALLFILRCLVPLAILFGVSYLLRKMGLVAAESPEPPDDRDENGGEAGEVASRTGSGGIKFEQEKPVEKTRSRSK